MGESAWAAWFAPPGFPYEGLIVHIFFSPVSRKWGESAEQRWREPWGHRCPLPSLLIPSISSPPSFFILSPVVLFLAWFFPSFQLWAQMSSQAAFGHNITELPSRTVVYFLQQNMKACEMRRSIFLSLCTHVDLSDGVAFPGYLLAPLNNFNAALLNLVFQETPSSLRGHMEQNTVIWTKGFLDQPAPSWPTSRSLMHAWIQSRWAEPNLYQNSPSDLPAKEKEEKFVVYIVAVYWPYTTCQKLLNSENTMIYGIWSLLLNRSRAFKVRLRWERATMSIWQMGKTEVWKSAMVCLNGHWDIEVALRGEGQNLAILNVSIYSEENC